jgi:hypothetical protein
MNELPNWMKELSLEKNNEEFSLLCHQYFKLATMRVMQEMREKHQIPPYDIPTITIAIFARFLNEACYAIGAAIMNGMKIDEIFDKEQRLNLLNVLMGKFLDPRKRSDINTNLEESLEEFKSFIRVNARDFYVEQT